MKYFKEEELIDLWDSSQYSKDSYTESYPTDELIRIIEEQIGGYKLPASYIELMRVQNGGLVNKYCFPTTEPTGWAEDHIAITGIMGIGADKTYSLCGSLGSNFMKEQWGYPDIGVCIADTPTAGHEMIMLDYRSCGKDGIPQVVYVDQEDDYSITVLAPSFEEFIKGLVYEDEFEEDAFEYDLELVKEGTFSPIVLQAFHQVDREVVDIELLIRRLGEKIVNEKGFFALHADQYSHLMFDTMFWLYSILRVAKSFDYFMNTHNSFPQSYDEPSLPLMIFISLVDEDYGFKTGGYAADFVKDWWNKRIEDGQIIASEDGYVFTDTAIQRIQQELRQIVL